MDEQTTQTEQYRFNLEAARAEGRRTATIGVVQQKGGVGKTMSAVNLADALSRWLPKQLRTPKYQPRVLLVDLDPQASATEWMGTKYLGDTAWVQGMPVFHGSSDRWAPPADLACGIPDLFACRPMDDGAIDDVLSRAILPVPDSQDRLWLLGTALAQQVVEREWVEALVRAPDASGRKAAHYFAERLTRLAGAFDAIVFDASPGLSEATDALHIVSEQLVLPVGPNFPSLVALLRTRDSMLQVLAREAALRGETGYPPRAIHVVLNAFFASRTRQGEEFQSLLEMAFGPDFVAPPLKYRVDLTMIANVQERLGRGLTVFEAGPQAVREQEFFTALARRVLDRAFRTEA
ncbi:MAG: ParA family protein [Gemmatimonadaceae bacterium]|nr:ParA family protein [Gemmatimonadaceae bacterium]